MQVGILTKDGKPFAELDDEHGWSCESSPLTERMLNDLYPTSNYSDPHLPYGAPAGIAAGEFLNLQWMTTAELDPLPPGAVS